MSESKEKKVSKKIMFTWPTGSISIGIAAVFAGFITYFATDFMGISAVSAGIIFMISKLFDGITDLIAGYIVDHTHTKWGKGRPYELTLIGYWLTIVLMFAAPNIMYPIGWTNLKVHSLKSDR